MMFRLSSGGLILMPLLDLFSLAAADTAGHNLKVRQSHILRRETGSSQSHLQVKSQSHADLSEATNEDVREMYATYAHRESLDKFVLGLYRRTVPFGEVSDLFGELTETLLDHGFSPKALEGHIDYRGELAKQSAKYDEWAKTLKLNTICETGFNAGHSALRFLARSDAKLYEFDLGSHAYSKVAADFLHHKFPGRLNITWGDSLQELTKFRERNPDLQCDLVVVDGGHGAEVCASDLQNFGKMAAPNAIVAIDDTPCKEAWCGGPTTAWHDLIAQGCIEEVGAVPMGSMRGFSFGKFKTCSLWYNDLLQTGSKH